MSHQFDEGLSGLKGQLFTMASLAEQQIGKAVKALVDRDAALAEQVRQDDAGINRLEVEIEDACLTLMARFQPEAGDLRFIAMVFKIVNDLERVGDQAVNISERTVDLLKQPLLKPFIDIPTIAKLSQKMLKDALDAFVAQDAELAREVCRNDDQVDRLNDQIHSELLEYMQRDPQTITRALDLIFISRNLERVADHATNIAEDVYYLVKGSTIKHRLAGI